MSVSGTGTQNDPYIVTTWAELVAKAAENGKYIKVGDNIDVMLEYSEGNAPTLVLNGYVDGDGKTISRWMNTGSNYLITTYNNPYYIKNTIFTNIKTTYSLIQNLSSHQYNTIISDCKFAGVMGDGYVFDGSGSGYSGELNGVVVNIKGEDLHLLRDYTNNNHTNCNIKLQTSATWLNYIYAGDRDQKWYDSYFDITAPNLTSIKSGDGRVSFDNCVLDIKSDGAFTFDTRNSMLSIFNSTNAPNAVGTAGKIVGVDDTHWLDAEYLEYTVGFNIVEEE